MRAEAGLGLLLSQKQTQFGRQSHSLPRANLQNARRWNSGKAPQRQSLTKRVTGLDLEALRRQRLSHPESDQLAERLLQFAALRAGLFSPAAPRLRCILCYSRLRPKPTRASWATG